MTTETPTFEVEKEEVEGTEGAERTHARRAYVPRADIFENDDAIVIVSDMPGVDDSSVELLLEKNVLTITGTPQDADREGLALAYAEYEMGDYTRRFTLSDQIDQEKIEATVKDGVLRLHLPKAEPAKARKIAVRAG